MDFLEYYKGKRVLITGHTGFKGSWLCKILVNLGADVTGYALSPAAEPSLYRLAALETKVNSVMGNITDYEKLKTVFDEVQPEVVLHLAAQPLVRESYKKPRETYETNVMGTVNVLECVHQTPSVRSVLNVTTDKVYRNREWQWGYRENEELGGYDPYSNSKACSEFVTESYQNSFFREKDGSYRIPISTARAGNVIGGGDFSADRILPDCIRAAIKGEDIIIRNPRSIRPYQHVLEPLFAYLMIAAAQYYDRDYAGSYNVGPEERDCYSTGDLADCFVKCWGNNLAWVNRSDGGPHEATFLKLDCSKLKNTFGWKPRWDLETAVEKTVEWTKCWLQGEEVSACMDRQIEEFLKG